MFCGQLQSVGIAFCNNGRSVAHTFVSTSSLGAFGRGESRDWKVIELIQSLVLIVYSINKTIKYVLVDGSKDIAVSVWNQSGLFEIIILENYCFFRFFNFYIINFD